MFGAVVYGRIVEFVSQRWSDVRVAQMDGAFGREKGDSSSTHPQIVRKICVSKKVTRLARVARTTKMGQG